MALKYFKKMHGESQKEEITYEKALNILLGTYRDNDMTRDMLTIPNNIYCRMSSIYVEDHKDNGIVMVLMSGLQNDLPFDAEYDDEGNRV